MPTSLPNFHAEGAKQPATWRPQLLTGLHPSVPFRVIIHGDTHQTPYFAIGGYRACGDGTTFVLIRWYYSFDTVGRLEGGDTISLGGIRRADAYELWPEEWRAFMKLKEGDRFQLGGRIWQKLTMAQVAEVCAGRVFTEIRGDLTSENQGTNEPAF